MTPSNELAVLRLTAVALPPTAERVSRELSRWFDHSDFAARSKESLSAGQMLKLMSFFGAIWDLRPVPSAVREAAGKRV